MFSQEESALNASRVPFVLAVAAVVGLLAGRCPAQNWKDQPTYGTVALKAGATANATSVKVEAGGGIQTKLGGVAAWIANPPDVRLNYAAGSSSLIFRVESDADTTLLINLPDGTWIANDDGPNTGLNPYIQIPGPPSGQYDIWVGTFANGKFPPAMLFISDVAKEAVQSEAQFAVVEFENRTSKHPVRFKFRWSERDAWSKPLVLKPGRHETLSQPHTGSRPPSLQVEFEKGIGIDAGSTSYMLEAYPSRTKADGKGYNFVARTAADTREFIDLVKRTKAEEDASFKLAAAIVRILARDYKNGIDLATRAIQRDPTSARAHAIRGRGRLFAGEYDGALRDFAQAARLAPSDPEPLVDRAETFNRKKRYDRVVDEAGKALDLDPYNVSALTERALASFAMRDYDAASADARKAIKIEPRSWLPLTTLGECFIAKGQHVVALDFLNQAIAIHAADFEPFAARSQAHRALGDAVKSGFDLQQAARLGMPASFAVHYPDDEALRALDSYQLGTFVTPDLLKKFNTQSFEVEPPYPGKAPPTLAPDVEELVTAEWSRHRAFKFEATAGVDRFLAAARLTEAQRKAKGMQLDWYYGPVTSPVARFRSGDDLGGLRIIGSLKLPDRKELIMIFALTYYPPTGEKVENGQVGMLFDGDNSRIQLRLHNKGELESDYLFQSFGANVQKGTMVMRPGYNLDETAGTMVRETLTSASLSTRCMHCHNKGFEPSEKLLEQVKIRRSNSEEEISKLEGLKKFLELAYVNGAGRIELKQMERQLIKSGPESLLPLDDLYKANRQYWLEIYPQYVDLRRNPRAYLDNAPRRDPTRPSSQSGAMKH